MSGRSIPIRWSLAVVLWISAGPLWEAAAAEVGDRVEFTRGGATLRGIVKEVRPGGKFLSVQADYQGQTRKILVLADQAKVIPSDDAGSGTVRTWSDQSGSFKVSAALISQSPTQAKLRKIDGTMINVPIERLSIEDQEYLATQDAGGEPTNPFEVVSGDDDQVRPRDRPPATMTDEFRGGSEASPNGSAASLNGSSASLNDSSASLNDSSASPGGALDLSSPETLATGKTLSLITMSPPKDFQPSPSRVEFSQLGSGSAFIADTPSRTELTRPVLISASGTTMATALKTRWSADDKSTKVYRHSVESGRSREVARVTGHSFWIASADPSTGDALAVVDEPRGTKSSSLAVLGGIADSSPRLIRHWMMYPDQPTKSDFVRYRRMVGGGLVLVVYDSMARMIDYRAGRELWRCKLSSFNEPAVTASSLWTALPADGHCAIVETKSGRQIGSIPIEARGAISLGFSSDGARLAVASGTQVWVYQTATAELLFEHEANVTLAKLGGHIAISGDDHLILPTGKMISISKDLLFWSYNLRGDELEFADWSSEGMYPVAGGQSVGFVRLPHPAALKALDQPPSNLAAINPGDAVAVESTGSGPGAEPDQIRQWLTAAAERSGYRVADSSPHRLTVTIERGKKTKRSYRNMGRFGSTEVSFTPFITKIEVQSGGQTLWQRTSTSSMPFLVSGDKPLKKVARESEKPDAKMIEQLELPSMILKKEYQDGFGQSDVSIKGVVDRRL